MVMGERRGLVGVNSQSPSNPNINYTLQYVVFS